jgi:hypothetical protein
MDKRGRARKQAVRVKARQMAPCKPKDLDSVIRREEIIRKPSFFFLIIRKVPTYRKISRTLLHKNQRAKPWQYMSYAQ